MNGLLTIAFGSEYDRIVAHTILYALRLIPDLPPICVITNIAEDKRCSAWEEVLQICNIDFIYGEGWLDENNRRIKMQMSDLTPFDKTIYIDADAVIQKQGIECIFDMLDHADIILNGIYYWRRGEKVPKIYAKAMLACGAKLPLECYNGGFIAWRKGNAAESVFETWVDYWERTGSGRDMPALACAIQHVKPLIFDVGRAPVFAPDHEDNNCIIQHNYNDTFLSKFDLPFFQESKPFDSDPSDFRLVDFIECDTERKIFLDVGSHKGQSIRQFYKEIEDASEWLIYSFEPLFDNIFDKYNNVIFIKAAVSVEDGMLDIFPVPDEGQGGTTIKGKLTGSIDYKSAKRVNCIDFVRWFKKNINEEDFVIVKINIEGGEYSLMKHLPEILPNIDGMHIKLHHNKFESDVKSELLTIYNNFKLHLQDCETFVFCDPTEEPYKFKWLVDQAHAGKK